MFRKYSTVPTNDDNYSDNKVKDGKEDPPNTEIEDKAEDQIDATIAERAKLVAALHAHFKKKAEDEGRNAHAEEEHLELAVEGEIGIWRQWKK